MDDNDIDLKDLLPDDFEGRDSLSGKYNSVEDLAKAYQNLATKLSSTARVPEESATGEEWDSFYSRMGRPETPHGYVMPDGEKEKAALDPLTKVAHEAGLTKEQWEKMSGVAQKQLVRNHEAEQTSIDKAREEWQDSAKRKYGETLDEKLAAAKRTLDNLNEQNPDIGSVLNKTGLVDHPAILDLMIQTGESEMDDTTPSGSISAAGGDEDAMQMAIKIRQFVKKGSVTNSRHIDYEVDYPEFIKLQEKLLELGYEGATDERLKSPKW